MKIRIAINSTFLSRKIRGAAYGMLLLLTFFVPQFAKTQDQLNAVKPNQAVNDPGIALEKNIVTASPAEAQPALIAALTPTALPVAAAPHETAGLSPTPDFAFEDATDIDTSAASTAIEPVVAEPVMTASLAPAVLPAEDAPARETTGLSPVAPIALPAAIEEVITQPFAPVTAEPVMIASLTRSFLPAAAQSPSGSGPLYTGEYITADFVNVPLVDFFRTMSDVGGINIILDPAISGNVNLRVVSVPWDQLFETVLRNHGLDKKIEGTVVRVARKATLQEEAKQEEALKTAAMLAGELENRVRRLNYAKASEMKDLIAEQKSPRGTVVTDDRTNSLILTDLPEYIDKQMILIAALDIPQSQVEIETRIVSATRNFSRDIGVQFGFVQGNMQRVTVGGGNANFLQPGPAERPMSDFTSSNSPGVSTGLGDTGGNLNVNLPARTPFGGIGVAVGNIFDTFLLDAAITAGESKGTARMISQPKVVAQNNRPAVINNGMRIPITVNSDNTITIQFIDAALMLTVTPQITFEGNILLDLNVTNNKADFGYISLGGVPTVRTSEARSSILVSDGGTTMFGGIFVEDDSTNEDRVPGLGSLPILGNLFRRTGASRDTQEILFFVTPRILR